METALRCGRCDRPICIKCSISGPAGMRCPDCASLRSSQLYQIHPGRLVLTVVLAVIAGTIGAAIIFEVSWFVLFIGPIYGAAVAEVVLRASGRKRGRILEAIGVGSIVLGAVIVIGLPSLIMLVAASHAHALRQVAAFLPAALFGFLWPLVGVGLAISACFSKLRYF